MGVYWIVGGASGVQWVALEDGVELVFLTFPIHVFTYSGFKHTT